MNEESKMQAEKNAKTIFESTKSEYQELIRAILSEERQVMHLQRRNHIHNRIYDHIKRVIK